MRVRARGVYTPTRHHIKTLAAITSSRPNPETLATRKVLAHPCVVLYPYRCGLREGATAVTAELISYDNMEPASRMTTRRR
jgi:hypothetical protein